MTSGASGREIRASGAGPEAGQLRQAYLELLKLALCDLVGPATTSVEGLADGGLVSRELEDDERALRADGRDWPLHALSMSGLARLDDLQACVETVASEAIEGDVIEAGSWRGGGSILMRAVLDSLGDRRAVWVADSFQGFPAFEPERGDEAPRDYPETVAPYLAAFDFLAAPLEEVQAGFTRLGYGEGVRFVPGFFEETLPGLAGRRWSIIRLDADSYEATLLALRCLYPGLVRGGYLIVDDYGALDECRAAVDDYRAEAGVSEPVVPVDWTGVRWRRETEAAPASPSASRRTEPKPRSANRKRRRGPVATERELSLAGELAAAQERIAVLEAEVEQLREAERELSEVRTSTSWRVTRPLRELGRYIRERQR